MKAGQRAASNPENCRKGASFLSPSPAAMVTVGLKIAQTQVEESTHTGRAHRGQEGVLRGSLPVPCATASQLCSRFACGQGTVCRHIASKHCHPQQPPPWLPSLLPGCPASLTPEADDSAMDIAPKSVFALPVANTALKLYRCPYTSIK